MKLKLFILLIGNLFLISKSDQISTPELIEIVKSAVVFIQTDEKLGSGVVITREGYIITNYHVVEGYSNNIRVTTHDKGEYLAKVIDYDDDLDICLLKTKPLESVFILPIIKPENIKIGEDVICIGSPFGITDYVTKGIISKFTTPYIYTTASINPGNSGGALINLNGELVGIPTMFFTNAQNFNYALCPRTIRYFLNKNKIDFFGK